MKPSVIVYINVASIPNDSGGWAWTAYKVSTTAKHEYRLAVGVGCGPPSVDELARRARDDAEQYHPEDTIEFRTALRTFLRGSPRLRDGDTVVSVSRYDYRYVDTGRQAKSEMEKEHVRQATNVAVYAASTDPDSDWTGTVTEVPGLPSRRYREW